MKRLFSAGGVVYKFEGDKLKILLIATKNKKVWSFPKGHIEKGEKPTDTALREIKEETGIEGKITDDLGEVSYWFEEKGEKILKTVKYFLVEYVAGQINPNWEIDDTNWFSVDESFERITYKTDRDVLKKALEKLYGKGFRQGSLKS